MKRTLAVTCLLWMFIWAGLGVWGACPANNPNNPFAITMQGGDPTGNLGYPIAVVGATGCPLDVNVVGGGGGGGCVTQCTSPWIVSGTVTANQGTTPWRSVGVNSSNQVNEILGDANPHASLGQNLPVGASINYVYSASTGEWSPVWSFLNFATQGLFSGSNAIPAGLVVEDFDPNLGFRAAAANFTPRSIELNGAFGQQLANQGLSSNCPMKVSAGAATSLTFSADRTPATFKTVAAAAAGNTPLWAPAAGKRFRLMRWRYTVTDNATLAAPGVLTVTLNDAGGAIGQADDVFVPAIALVNNGQLAVSPWIDLGNGILSVAANNVLNVNLSAALITGTVRVQVCGTEE